MCRSIPLFAGLFLVGSVASCDSAGGPALSKLEMTRMAVYIGGFDSNLQLQINASGCPTLPGLTATLNDGPLPQISAGGETGGWINRSCSAIGFAGSVTFSVDGAFAPPDPGARFTVTDGRTTWHMDVPELLARRQLSIPGSALRADVEQVVTIAPATDGVAAFDARFFFKTQWSQFMAYASAQSVQIEGATVRFVIPFPEGSDLPDPIEGRLSLSASEIRPHVGRCDGPASCNAIVNFVEYTARATLGRTPK